MISVPFTPQMMRMAASAGIDRRIESKDAGRRDQHGLEEYSPWDIDIEGAASEFAVAKMLDHHWGGDLNTFKKADIGVNLQVRHAAEMGGNSRLIIRPGDNPDDYYVFVTGTYPMYFVHGWIVGRDGMRDEWWEIPKSKFNRKDPAWFIPRRCLHPFTAR